MKYDAIWCVVVVLKSYVGGGGADAGTKIRLLLETWTLFVFSCLYKVEKIIIISAVEPYFSLSLFVFFFFSLDMEMSRFFSSLISQVEFSIEQNLWLVDNITYFMHLLNRDFVTQILWKKTLPTN